MRFALYDALLSVQSALINGVTPQLRAVTVDIDEQNKKLVLWFFYNGVISDELFELTSLVGTDVNHPDYLNSENIIRLDFPEKIPIRGRLAFLRREPIPTEFKRENRAFLLQQQKWPIHAVFRLNMQEALLGKITPSLRFVSVKVDTDQKRLVSHFVYDGKISEEIFNLTNLAISEAGISFSGFHPDSYIERLDFPNKITSRGEWGVYFRQEWKY